MKKTLLLFILFMFIGCDVKYDIFLPLIDEGVVIGYDGHECTQMRWFCEDEEGEYVFNIDPDANFMCSCTWD